jgi:TPR repeat protein
VEHGIAEAQYCFALFFRTKVRCSDVPFFGDKTLTWKENRDKASAEALKLLRLASEQGHADSQILLGITLCENYSSEDYSQPNNEALRMLKQGVKQGSARTHSQGLHKIALCYRRLGDHVEEFYHYKLASDQGYLESTFKLAEMHKDGKGVAKNVKEAVDIYKRLIENGDINMRRRSIEAIRDLYLEVGDNAEALKWCKQSVDEEITWYNVHNFARMLEGWDPRDWSDALEGDGIERDFAEAAKYYKLACDLFSDDDEVAVSAYELAKM